jgi:hypothetical protein
MNTPALIKAFDYVSDKVDVPNDIWLGAAYARVFSTVKYDPSQPREPKGSENGGQWTGESGIPKNAKEAKGRIDKYLATIGFDKSRIVYEKKQKGDSFGYNVLMEYDTDAKVIHVYPSALKKGNVDGLMAHEIGHAETVGNLSLIKAGIEGALGNAVWEDKGWSAVTEIQGNVSEFLDITFENYIAGKPDGYKNYIRYGHEAYAELRRLDYEGKLESISPQWKAFYTSIKEAK